MKSEFLHFHFTNWSLEKWFKNLYDGEDPALADAYSKMEGAVNELSDAVGMETLATSVFILEIVHKMEKDVEILVSTTTRIEQVGSLTRANTEVLVGKIDMLTELYTKRSDEKSHGVASDHDGTKLQPKKGKTDPGEKRRVALVEVKARFKSKYPGFDLSVGMRARRKENSQTEAPVDGTGKWLLEEEYYKLWASTKSNHVLWIEGYAGIGKSFLCETMVLSMENPSTNFGSFFFRQGQNGLTSFNLALCYLSIQIAEKNWNYLENLASALDTKTAPFDPWKICFAERFPPKGDAHAWLVLDGIDEMDETDWKQMKTCLSEIKREDLNIHVVLSGRNNIAKEVEALDPLTINITKEKMEVDIEEFVLKKMEVLPHLSKFRRSVKKVIVKKLKEKADGMFSSDLYERIDEFFRHALCRSHASSARLYRAGKGSVKRPRQYP